MSASRQTARLFQPLLKLFSVALFSHGDTPVYIRRGNRGMVHSELELRLVVERRNLAVALPKLNVVAINKLFCLFPGLGIVVTFEGNEVVKMTV
jgi:hypothetical protein